MWAEQAWAVFRKDALVESRTLVNLNSLLFFALIALLIFSFALGPDPARLRSAGGAILWLAFVFAGILAFARSYEMEAENRAFEGLLLVAPNRAAIYVGKVLSGMAVMLLIEIIMMPLVAILYNLDIWHLVPALLLIGILGTLGFAAVGALYGALTMSLRARQVLLPLLLLPVCAPLLLGAVKATTSILTGSNQDLHLWLALLLVFDVVFVTAGLLTFEYAPTES